MLNWGRETGDPLPPSASMWKPGVQGPSGLGFSRGEGWDLWSDGGQRLWGGGAGRGFLCAEGTVFQPLQPEGRQHGRHEAFDGRNVAARQRSPSF